MSLFICEECGIIENTNCVNHLRNYDYNPKYPNMGLMDMHGHRKFDKSIGYDNISSIEVKVKIDRGDIVMLCSQCNTGEWHNEFERKLPNEVEIAISTFSKYSAITPYDHPEGCIVKDDNADHGYSFNKEFLDNYLYLEPILPDPNVFANERGISIGSMVNPKAELITAVKAGGVPYIANTADFDGEPQMFRAEKSEVTDKAFLGSMMAMYGGNLFKLRPGSLSVKNDFTEEQHSKTIRKAELKREIKSLKKQKGYNITMLEQLQKEYKEL